MGLLAESKIHEKDWRQFINAQTSINKYAALHYAVKNKHFDVMKDLLEKQAEVSVK